MKISTINNTDLKKIILEYLPEANAVKNPATVLKHISQILAEFLRFFRFRTTLEGIFLAFEQLSYPMMVIEPMDRGNIPAPYRATNARAIYIGIDLGAFHTLKGLTKHLAAPGAEQSAEIKEAYERVLKFQRDVARPK